MQPDALRPFFDAALEGDDAAMRALVRLTQPLVWKVCTALGSPGDEEDLVQETYLQAVRSARTYRGDAPVQPWLLAIARHVCADHVRRRQRQRRLGERLRMAALESSTTIATEGLDELVDQLSPERREAFVLTQVVGLSYEDAALTLGCPIGTIRSRVARARTDLFDAVARADAR
jgi:RNA polymerase sigma-70 factor (ECF subfamily)